MEFFRDTIVVLLLRPGLNCLCPWTLILVYAFKYPFPIRRLVQYTLMHEKEPLARETIHADTLVYKASTIREPMKGPQQGLSGF